MKQRLIQLYRYSPPQEMIHSIQYGDLPYAGWLQAEKKRLEKAGRIVEIKKLNNGYVSLWVNNISASRYERRLLHARVH